MYNQSKLFYQCVSYNSCNVLAKEIVLRALCTKLTPKLSAHYTKETTV